MIAQGLILAGSGIILLLGTAHLYFTFFTDFFVPKDSALVKNMEVATISRAKGTNLWNAWIGFNGSHSAGAIFFGIINIYLVSQYFDLYIAAYFLQILNIVNLFFYLFLAKKYWFKSPFIGILMATICFVLSTILMSLGY